MNIEIVCIHCRKGLKTELIDNAGTQEIRVESCMTCRTDFEINTKEEIIIAAKDAIRKL